MTLAPSLGQAPRTSAETIPLNTVEQVYTYLEKDFHKKKDYKMLEKIFQKLDSFQPLKAWIILRHIRKINETNPSSEKEHLDAQIYQKRFSLAKKTPNVISNRVEVLNRKTLARNKVKKDLTERLKSIWQKVNNALQERRPIPFPVKNFCEFMQKDSKFCGTLSDQIATTNEKLNASTNCRLIIEKLSLESYQTVFDHIFHTQIQAYSSVVECSQTISTSKIWLEHALTQSNHPSFTAYLTKAPFADQIPFETNMLAKSIDHYQSVATFDEKERFHGEGENIEMEYEPFSYRAKAMKELKLALDETYNKFKELDD
ncbi:MAG: hypothetical protein AAGI90_00625 [Chlamydiota bacterium]